VPINIDFINKILPTKGGLDESSPYNNKGS
jgi:hypothetical protein